MVQIQRMLHALKMVFISLLNDGNNDNNKKDTETNEMKTINTLNKSNTTKLNFISICQNVPFQKVFSSCFPRQKPEPR